MLPEKSTAPPDEAQPPWPFGATVTVTVDRPMGSAHPKFSEMIYPVNYGYIEGIFAGDGQDQDAYILGVSHPAAKLVGTVIAVIHRQDDVEAKWVVVPEGTVLYEPEIQSMTRFQEQYFASTYTCLYEKSCGAVLHRQKSYLLIQNESGHIGFPKGHVELGETERQTALREVFEETGLTVALHPDFRESYHYKLDLFKDKQAVYFLASFDGEVVTQQNEVLNWWLVEYKQAMQLLNMEQDRQILKKVNGLLNH